MVTAIMEKKARPFLKWAGGKGKLIPQYEAHFPKKFKTYYEPFLGGGAVFFHLYQNRPGFQAVLSDINPELINAYCCVRDHVDDLINILQEHQAKHNKLYYYEMRAKKSRNNLEMAARFIYLNKTCFNGLYRENSQGLFNVPMGNYLNPGICQPDVLKMASEALQSAIIEVRSFKEIRHYARGEDDFVYFDPPYHPLNNTSSFTSYSRFNFRENDQIELRDIFAELGRLNVQVMLSNSDANFIREIYQDTQGFPSGKYPILHEIGAARAINSAGHKRGKIIELLVTYG